MSDLKVGDKVRVKGAEQVGRITKRKLKAANGTFDFAVDFSKAGMPFELGYDEHELEKVK